MKSAMRILVSFFAVVLVFSLSTAPASAVEGGDTEGCTPGYWKVKQHHDSWQEAEPSTAFVEAFRAAPGGAAMSPVGYVTEDLTMLQALNGKGGPGLDGARQILARAATAAWLNSAYDDGDHLQFPWRRWARGFNGEPPLVETVVSALSGNDRGAMLDLAARLDRDNNLGCPLS
jgi:hypothetical protein